jgi:hypothetical protein
MCMMDDKKLHKCEMQTSCNHPFNCNEYEDENGVMVLQLTSDFDCVTPVNFCPMCGYQPERSKREGFQCCRCRVLISAVTRGKEEFLDTFEVLVDSGSSLCTCKMRCFEYCGIKE